MAEVAIADISAQDKSNLALTYATLLLFDGGVDVNEDNLNKLFNVTSNSVEKLVVKVYAKTMEGKDVDKYLTCGGGGGGQAQGGAGGAGKRFCLSMSNWLS